MNESSKLENLFVEITNKCALKCRHCSSEASPSGQEHISINQLVALIDQAYQMGLKSFTISGGEPFLHPDIKELLKYLKKKDISTCIYTSGVIQEGNDLIPFPDRLVDFLRNGLVHNLIFSIQGADSLTHDNITGISGSQIITLESIAKVKKNLLPFEIHFVPMKLNYLEIPQVINLAEQLGANQVSLLRLVPQGRCLDSKEYLLLDRKTAEEFESYVKELTAQPQGISIRLGTPFNCVTESEKVCSASLNKLLISASGEVFPCEAFKFLKGLRNNIHNTELRMIWKNDILLNHLRNISLKDIKVCGDCPSIESCRGGCPGQRMLYNGDIAEGPEPYCKYILAT
ncbi:Radical SAM domain protein [Desulforamulus reducens MI-1]|uniref:Radical SAM domain protein n=1 Tax=Desulforamulus reducens (strain ATCC BAA-1160 / DSM 100696 / MI-1) TaxID=349161 RepID=A4J1V8_DESRM|nr:radical SAM protein [Desulforamulus reducens]ABO49061.1 Radical SAM domain protein [Desulforamulus reducens MI-1]